MLGPFTIPKLVQILTDMLQIYMLYTSTADVDKDTQPCTTQTCMYHSLTKEGPLTLVCPPPNLELTCKSAHLAAKREFPLSNKLEDVVRQVCTHYKVQITQLHSGLH